MRLRQLLSEVLLHIARISVSPIPTIPTLHVQVRAYRQSVTIPPYLGGYLSYDLYYHSPVPSLSTQCLSIPLQS